MHLLNFYRTMVGRFRASDLAELFCLHVAAHARSVAERVVDVAAAGNHANTAQELNADDSIKMDRCLR